MDALDFLAQHETEHLEQLKELLRIPSVSAQSEHAADTRRCAGWVADHLRGIGLSAEVCETGGHPAVIAEYQGPAGAPTVLVYGHYDVQPADPVELWQSAPFDPIESDGYLLARGVTDDKGQFFAHVKGAEACLRTAGAIPCSLKFLIEGEEESGSAHLNPFIEANRERLAADVVVISDGCQYGPDMPAINFGLRGLAFVEVKITGPDRDLHSGSYGGAVANPVNMLARMIGQLHFADGRIRVPGFYDRVYTATAWEREQFARLPFDAKAYRRSTGAPALWGEPGYTPLERTWIRPTLDVNGITGGYQGEGGKTIIPAWASAKITMRLVPDMTPEDTAAKLEAYLRQICPPSVRLEVIHHGGAPAVQVPVDGPWLEAAARALETGFGRRPFFTKEGGSIPVVGTFKSVLGIDTLLIGFGQQTDNPHSPNERMLIRDFHRGGRTSVALFHELAGVRR
ncbi:MAG: dipeptidase [Acidobacteria bacterium]|nr:dipeptidase [Acidobacteriota bacterium]